MAMLVPHQSQMQIQVANAGPAAQTRDASAFLSAGAKAMPGALQGFANGIDKLNNTLVSLEVARRKEILDLKLLQSVQQYRTNMTRADDEYMQKFQGENALDAEDQATARYRTAMDALAQEFRGNAYAQEYIQRQAGALAVAGVERMREYGNRQLKAFTGSVFAGEEAMFLDVLRDWRTSPEQAEDAWRSYAPKAIAYYRSEGLDPAAATVKAGAVYRAAMGDRAEAGINAAIEQGDFAEAERLLKGGNRGDLLPQDVRELAEKAAKTEGLDPALVKSMIAVESGGNPAAVSPAGARGLMQLMPVTAKELEVDPDDPEQNVRGGARYLKRMLEKYEGNLPLALMAYNGGPGNVDHWLKTGKWLTSKDGLIPREAREYAGKVLGIDALQVQQFLDPARRMGLENRLEAARVQWEKRVETATVESVFADLSGKLSGAASIDEQDSIAGTYIGGIKDAKVAKGVKALYDAQRSVKALAQKAQDTVLGMEFRRRAKKDGITPAQSEYMEKPNGFSEEGWERAKKSLHKDAQIPTSTAWKNYHAVLRDIDLGKITDNTDIDAFAFDALLTDRQIESARKYLSEGGNAGKLTFSKVESLYRAMGHGAKGKRMPDDFFDLVQQNLEPGKPVTDEHLRKVIADLYMDGESKSDSWYYPGYGPDETYKEALEKGRGDAWLPDVPEEDRRRITQYLESNGVRATDERIRSVYKEERGIGRAK